MGIYDKIKNWMTSKITNMKLLDSPKDSEQQEKTREKLKRYVVKTLDKMTEEEFEQALSSERYEVKELIGEVLRRIGASQELINKILQNQDAIDILKKHVMFGKVSDIESKIYVENGEICVENSEPQKFSCQTQLGRLITSARICKNAKNGITLYCKEMNSQGKHAQFSVTYDRNGKEMYSENSHYLEDITIDKGFIDICKYLNDNDLITWSSCDGILANHQGKEDRVIKAYISFLESPKILDLITAFYKNDKFELNLSNLRCSEPYYYGYNLIKGNIYGIYFNNKLGQNTAEFEEIAHNVCGRTSEEKQDNERVFLESLSKELVDDEQSLLNISVTFNQEVHTDSNIDRKDNYLQIDTKSGVSTLDLIPIVKDISEKYNLKIITGDDMLDGEYIKYYENMCFVHLKKEHFGYILDIIREAKKLEKILPAISVKYADEYDEFYKDDDYEWDDEAKDSLYDGISVE